MPGNKPKPFSVRFFAKVNLDGGPIHPSLGSRCWEWSSTSLTSRIPGVGYGVIFHRGRTTVAHRAAYLEFVGEVPDGMDLDHLCRNRKCVNPQHLEPVTRSENLTRGIGPKLKRLAGIPARQAKADRIAKKALMCSNGHLKSECSKPRAVNPRWTRCTACARDATRKYRAMKLTSKQSEEIP